MYFDRLVGATSPGDVLRDNNITFTRGAKVHGDDIESSCLCWVCFIDVVASEYKIC